MAGDPGHARPDLTPAEGARTDAFELLRQLECDGRRFGRGGGPEREPARLGQTARLAFAAADVAEFRPGAGDAPDHVALNILGLLGPEGPMPLHLTRWVLERLSNRWFAGDAEGATSDTAFLDFANMLQHRQIALFWRAWADARPEAQLRHGAGGRVPAMLRALAGVGLPGTDAGSAARTEAKVRNATSLAQVVQGPERLLRYLADIAGSPVRLREFVGVWTEVPAELATRLGRRHAALGQSAVIGPRVFERQSRAELRIGPLDLGRFTAWLDDGALQAELRHAIAFAMSHEICFDLRLVLRAEAVPDARLGECRLGRTAWLSPQRDRDADDLRFAAFSRRGVMAEAA